jgi:hypothetical protein
LGGYALAHRFVQRRRDQLARRLDNRRLCVLVVGQGVQAAAWAQVLANACLAVDWVGGADLVETARQALQPAGWAPTAIAPRVLACPDAACEYDLALVTAPATELDSAALRLRMVPHTPVLVLSRQLAQQIPYEALFGGEAPLVGVPWPEERDGRAGPRGLLIGEADGARSHQVRLAQRLLARSGLTVRVERHVVDALRRYSLLVTIEALARRGRTGAAGASGVGGPDWRALVDDEARTLCSREGLDWPPQARALAANWLRQAPVSPQELEFLGANLLSLAHRHSVPTPMLAQLGRN